MSILVTGGAGFVGSYLIRSLLRRGETVVAIDANFVDNSITEVLTPAELERVARVRADVADPVAFFRTIRDHRVDRIVHLARLSIPAGDADPWAGVRVNVQGTLTSFEAARILGVERVVWASSLQVYGSNSTYAVEFGSVLTGAGPHRPSSVYTAAKSVCEHLATHYHRKFDVDLRGLRPVGVFGPGRRGERRRVDVTAVIQAAALGKPTTLANADYALQQTYVEDVARAFELALYHEGRELTGQTVNIGALLTTHREVVETVRRVVPGAEITVTPGDGGEPMALPVDNSALRRATGFELQVDLEEGVRRTVEYFRRAKAGDR